MTPYQEDLETLRTAGSDPGLSEEVRAQARVLVALLEGLGLA